MVDLPHAGVKIASAVAGIASVPTSIDQRAQLLLEPLGRVVPFQGAWISLLDPEAPEQPPLVCHGYPSGLRSYMAGPAGVAEIEMLGLDRSGATRLSDLPVDLQEVPSWAEYLAPAGFRGGPAAALFTPGRPLPRDAGSEPRLRGASDRGRPGPDDQAGPHDRPRGRPDAFAHRSGE